MDSVLFVLLAILGVSCCVSIILLCFLGEYIKRLKSERIINLPIGVARVRKLRKKRIYIVIFCKSGVKYEYIVQNKELYSLKINDGEKQMLWGGENEKN